MPKVSIQTIVYIFKTYCSIVCGAIRMSDLAVHFCIAFLHFIILPWSLKMIWIVILHFRNPNQINQMQKLNKYEQNDTQHNVYNKLLVDMTRSGF
jgi:hypothetical protein